VSGENCHAVQKTQTKKNKRQNQKKLDRQKKQGDIDLTTLGAKSRSE
jgi:hypothetical protein